MASDEDPILTQAVTTASPRQPVKSNAVVKFSATSTLPYENLRSDTDLKQAPSNWFSSNADSLGLNYSLPHPTGFTSFRMAHTFPDCVGEVDVVSDSENVKKLLKIPYNNQPVSMIVHRIENTLLIDDFNIHLHLTAASESDWPWLYKFFYDIIIEKITNEDLPDVRRIALQNKILVSKFLHYSLAETVTSPMPNEMKHLSLPITPIGPALPEPLEEERLPDSRPHKFIRNVVWTFEDIQMLLGTDMPIFGGPNRPCISLKLRDAKKPISVLTGIDYWLDNLMSNVPEVVMCYHLDGIVQKYELLKTEDLPHLPESKFSPKLIQDVAQNILSFLKSNATKAGHTYWLFKGTNEDAVKLYDLTSLCSDNAEEDQNPFTVPVGMLLYRVARNMKASGDPGQFSTIRVLLKNCLSLLDREQYPQIVTSAHFMLSDVYIPPDTDPSSPEALLLPENDENFKDVEEEDTGPVSNSVPITDLCVANFLNNDQKYQPPPMICGLDERCNLALQHVSDGLNCLQFFNLESDAKHDEEEQKMAKPFEAIPMPYSKLDNKKDKKKKKGEPVKEIEPEDNSLKAIFLKPTQETIPKWKNLDKIDNLSWKLHLSSLLTKKACLVYSVLVEKEMQSGMFELAVNHIEGVLSCSDENPALVALMLSRAADCCINVLKPGRKKSTEIDTYPVVKRQKILYENEIKMLPKSFDNAKTLYEISIDLYKRSLELHQTSETRRKLGYAFNSLGIFYMAKSREFLTKIFNETEFYKLVEISEKLFDEGLENFMAVGDKINIALLLSNKGQLYRIKAHSPSLKIHDYFSSKEKQLFQIAIDFYSRALDSVGNRKTNNDMWDAIYWDLSTTWFTLASVLQDRPPPVTSSKSSDDLEREAIDTLQKALKYCDLTTNSAKLPLYQYRAAKIYHRLANLYYNSYRNHFDENKRKALAQLAQTNYSKGFHLYTSLDYPLDILVIQLEVISLNENLAKESKSPKTKRKYYVSAIFNALKCQEVLQIINDKEVTLSQENELQNVEKDEKEEEEKLMKLLLQRLQFLFKSLIVLVSSHDKLDAKPFKKLYELSLRPLPNEILAAHLCRILKLADKELQNEDFIQK